MIGERERIAAHTRWLIRRDLPEVLAIDAAGFGREAWDEEDFLSCLRHRSCIGMAAEVALEPVAYIVYELRERSLGILRAGVHPRFRRRGIGELMLSRLKGKLASHRRTSLEALVPEAMLSAQLWLRDAGFLCKGTVRGGEGDLYRFRYSLPGKERA